MGDFNFDFDLGFNKGDDNKYSQKYILAEAVLAMNYGWEQIPKCESNKECVFCMESFLDTYVLKLPCEHMFHRDCVLEGVVDFNFRECAECEEKFKFIIQPKLTAENKKNEGSKIQMHFEPEKAPQLIEDQDLYQAQQNKFYTSDPDFEVQFDYDY